MESTFDIDTATEEQLAEHCVDSAAALQGEDPVVFWGAQYAQVLEGSLEHINRIGLLNARRLYKAGKLDFPDSVYDCLATAPPRE